MRARTLAVVMAVAALLANAALACCCESGRNEIAPAPKPHEGHSHSHHEHGAPDHGSPASGNHEKSPCGGSQCRCDCESDRAAVAPEAAASPTDFLEALTVGIVSDERPAFHGLVLPGLDIACARAAPREGDVPLFISNLSLLI